MCFRRPRFSGGGDGRETGEEGEAIKRRIRSADEGEEKKKAAKAALLWEMMCACCYICALLKAGRGRVHREEQVKKTREGKKKESRRKG